MNLKKALGRERRFSEDELNITPVMNIFLILVPFLLLTAVFVRISIMEFSLPSTEKMASSQSAKSPVVTVLTIREDGFELTSKNLKFPRIRKNETGFDFDKLIEKLSEVKRLHNETEDIILAPRADIKYQTIIRVMDTCRENGFFNISISG